MRKIIILIPVYNDWESLKQLINDINENIKIFNDINFECLIINDASTIQLPDLVKPNKFDSMEILNMKENTGHARCNAFGIRYIFQNKKFDYLILMDGDGEDRPVEIKSLVEKIKSSPSKSVVAKRVKRSEGYLFQFLYQAHKLITFFFTGKNVNFGNYFSGSVKKHLKDFNNINSVRGLRYFGPSQMSLFKLIIHSLSIIAVFKYQVFIRSTLMIIGLAFLNSFLVNFSIVLQILIVFFNLIVFFVSKREIEKDLINSQKNLYEIKDITQ